MNVDSGYPDSRCIHAAALDDPFTFKPMAVVFREFRPAVGPHRFGT